jgi:Ni/Fe-hydrogenase subunit HybB-like protein
MEIAITLALVATGFFVFAMAVRYLPIFKHPEEGSEHNAVRVAERVLRAESLRRP